MMPGQEMYGEEIDYGQEMDPNQMADQGGDGSNALVSNLWKSQQEMS